LGAGKAGWLQADPVYPVTVEHSIYK
jgi:hypothetical protein